LIKNASMSEIMPQLTLLLVITLITIPLGFIIFRMGFNQARKVGSLAQY